MKDGLSQIIINVEAQKDEPQRYGIINRAVFYVSRLISSQKERDFENMEYDDIKRVYSIWVCMNMEENSLSHIHLVKDDLVGYHDWRGKLDLFNIVMIGLSKDLPAQGEPYENRIIMCEHPHVYTLGRSGKENNMLLNDDQLKAIQATLFHIDRGGDITYHGPGQLVCYPILNLEEFHLGLKEYVHLLEEAVIRVCASYGIEAGRLEKATGVWLEGSTPRARKICAIGVRSSHYVTMHGLALNVNTDLRYFSYIHPCGFIDKGVTSLRQELKHEVPMDEVKQRLECELSKLLNDKT